MADFQEAWEFVMDLEGWGVDHTVEGDPGGRTIWGISENNHPAMFHNGPPSREEALAFYRNHYWNPLRLGNLNNQNMVNEIMEFAVNSSSPQHGRPNVAIRTAQEAVNEVRARRGASSIAEDGIIGPRTINALNSLGVGTVASLAWDGVFNLRQLKWYRNLRPELVRRFFVGWSRRVIA